jgi:uncharacterized protein
MAKLLLLLAVIGGVALLLKNYQRSLARQDRDEPEQEAKSALEDMVRCARCGVHLPKSEGFLSQGSFYCSDEHRQQGPAERDRPRV